MGKAAEEVGKKGERSGVELLRARDPMTIVIFGASGDLARRKLLPALFRLHADGYLPERFAVVGCSRTPMSDEAYRESMRAALQEEIPGTPIPPQHPLIQSLHYHAGDLDRLESMAALKARIEELEQKRGLPGHRLFYLSIAPGLFVQAVHNLGEVGLARPSSDPHWSRVIIEKPFGRDLESSRALNAALAGVLDERQIFRIDHYLGKETVQNLLSFRFGNSIFEPLFNQKYISSVQITVAETLGMEGRRGAYYDTAGALRDMVQNHLLQLLCLTAMEPPPALDADAIRDEKVKVLRSLVPLTPEQVAENTLRGQYGPGQQEGKPIRAYRQEEGVAPDSITESYVALRVEIDNWRWAGVPFFLRTGKRLRRRISEISVEFKRPPLQLFRHAGNEEFCLLSDRPIANRLLFRIQPDEGLSLSVACKQPGLALRMKSVEMDFFYKEAFAQRSPEAYERLLLDALRGDASLFTRSDEVEYAWRYISSIHRGWAQLPPPVFPNYTPFSDGPAEAARLTEGSLTRWQSLSEP